MDVVLATCRAVRTGVRLVMLAVLVAPQVPKFTNWPDTDDFYVYVGVDVVWFIAIPIGHRVRDHDQLGLARHCAEQRRVLGRRVSESPYVLGASKRLV